MALRLCLHRATPDPVTVPCPQNAAQCHHQQLGFAEPIPLAVLCLGQRCDPFPSPGHDHPAPGGSAGCEEEAGDKALHQRGDPHAGNALPQPPALSASATPLSLGPAPKSVPKVRGGRARALPCLCRPVPALTHTPGASRTEPACVGPSCPPKAHPGPTALILHTLSALPTCQCGCQGWETVGKSPASCSRPGPSLPVLGSPSDRDRGYLWSLRASPLEGQVSGELWCLGKGSSHHPEGFSSVPGPSLVGTSRCWVLWRDSGKPGLSHAG